MAALNFRNLSLRADKRRRWGLKSLLFVGNIRERKIVNLNREGNQTSAGAV